LVPKKLEEVGIKHKVSNVNMDCKFTVISNLGIVRKKTEKDMCSLIDSDKKEKLRLEEYRSKDDQLSY
jgi:hypothetical protein